MKQKRELTKNNFSDLLNWFSPNSETAGRKYEEIRNGLTRFFRFRGCNDPDTLADETITRVALKLENVDLSEGYNKITYFYGFARNIYREYLAGRLKNDVNLDINKFKKTALVNFVEKEESPRFVCLDLCLKQVHPDEATLILKYFSKEKSEKILLRHKLSDELGISPGALHTKVHRIKNTISKCVKNCVREKSL